MDPLLQKDKGQLNSELLLSTKKQVHKLGQTNQHFRRKINSRKVYRQVQEVSGSPDLESMCADHGSPGLSMIDFYLLFIYCLQFTRHSCWGALSQGFARIYWDK